MKKQLPHSKCLIFVLVLACCFACFSCNQTASEKQQLPVNHYYAQATLLTFPDVRTLYTTPSVFAAAMEDGKMHFFGSDSQEMFSFESGIESYPEKTIIPFIAAFYEESPVRFIGLAEQLFTMEADPAYDYFLIAYDANNAKSTISLSTEFVPMRKCFYKDNIVVAVYADRADLYKVDFTNSAKELLSSYSYTGNNLNVCISEQCVLLTHEADGVTAVAEYNISENTYKTGEIPYADLSAVACAPAGFDSRYCIMTQNLLIGLDSDFSPVE